MQFEIEITVSVSVFSNLFQINYDRVGFFDIQFDASQSEFYKDGRMIDSCSRCRGSAVGYSFEKISQKIKLSSMCGDCTALKVLYVT